MKRREFLHLSAAAAAVPFAPHVARAQAGYPNKPVRILVGFAPGGATDTTARLMGAWLSERLGQQFIVENRPGAGTNLATEAVVRSAPDGYTILMVTASNAINATLYPNLTFNFLRDMVPVAGVIQYPNVVEVNIDLPVKNIPEFITYLKANPGKLSMGSGESMASIREKKIKALAVTTIKRNEFLPDIPTVNEFVPGYDAQSVQGFAAPKGTPSEIIERLNKEVNTEKWGKVVKHSGAKAE
jgi:tripartite-type tricarboxylate transporter receptor subunit TctC